MVPTVYSTVEVASVEFTGDTGPVNLPPEEVPGFVDPAGIEGTDTPGVVIGLHGVDPPVGSGNPLALDSLIGVRVIETGSHTDVTVAVFPTPFTNVDERQTFPPAPEGNADVVATLWEGQPDPDQGGTPITEGGEPVAASATITELDQLPES